MKWRMGVIAQSSVLIWLLAPGTSRAQERPKVGVALGGGAAKGLAYFNAGYKF